MAKAFFPGKKRLCNPPVAMIDVIDEILYNGHGELVFNVKLSCKK